MHRHIFKWAWCENVCDLVSYLFCFSFYSPVRKIVRAHLINNYFPKWPSFISLSIPFRISPCEENEYNKFTVCAPKHSCKAPMYGSYHGGLLLHISKRVKWSFWTHIRNGFFLFFFFKAFAPFFVLLCTLMLLSYEKTEEKEQNRKINVIHLVNFIRFTSFIHCIRI